jgi:hypothetical protein
MVTSPEHSLGELLPLAKRGVLRVKWDAASASLHAKTLPELHAHVRAVLQSPLARQLRGLDLAQDFSGNSPQDCDWTQLLRDVAERLGDVLEGLSINTPEDDWGVHLAGSAELELSRFAALRTLRVNLSSGRIHGFALPNLEVLDLGALCAKELKVLANAQLPALTQLRLWFGRAIEVPALERLLARFQGPRRNGRALSELRLMAGALGSPALDAIARVAPLENLRVLDLSENNLYTNAVQRLINLRPRLVALEMLNVCCNRFSEEELVSIEKEFSGTEFLADFNEPPSAHH